MVGIYAREACTATGPIRTYKKGASEPSYKVLTLIQIHFVCIVDIQNRPMLPVHHPIVLYLRRALASRGPEDRTMGWMLRQIGGSVRPRSALNYRDRSNKR